MKKNYFLLAASTMMFAACAQTDMVNEVVTEEAPQAIGFETFSNKATRAVTAATALDSYHEAFGVWAYKTTKTDGAVMDNYKVAYINSDWNYKDQENQSIKYWDKNADYTFYAYAPYAASGVTIENGVISIAQGTYAANENLQSKETVDGKSVLSTELNGNKFNGVGASSTTVSTDWMIAEEVPVTAGNYNKVNEVFKHTMSKVIVYVQSDIAGVEITDVNISGVYGTGSYKSTTGWDVTGVNTTKIEGLEGTLDVADEEYCIMEYLLIPGGTPKFNITYTISGDKYTVTDAAITNITTIEANTSYTVYVKVGLSPIEFTATASDFTNKVENGAVTIE